MSRSERPSPLLIAAAALLLGGLVVVAFPDLLRTLIPVVIVTIAAAVALSATLAAVPSWGGGVSWRAPFGQAAATEREDPGAPGEWARLQGALRGRRHRLAPLASDSASGAGLPTVRVALPPRILRTLRPLIAESMRKEGLDPADPAHAHALSVRLQPETLAILRAADPEWRPWYRTRRPAPEAVAQCVVRVLDDAGRRAPDSTSLHDPAVP